MSLKLLRYEFMPECQPKLQDHQHLSFIYEGY